MSRKGISLQTKGDVPNITSVPDDVLNAIIITKPWKRFIFYCLTVVPHGEVTVKIVNAQPTSLISVNPSVRFDKDDPLPQKPTFTAK